MTTKIPRYLCDNVVHLLMCLFIFATYFGYVFSKLSPLCLFCTLLFTAVFWCRQIFSTQPLKLKTCDWSAGVSWLESVLVGAGCRVDVFIVEVVSWEVRPASGRLFDQVDVDSDTVALTAAVIQTFLHWLCRLVLTRTHWILIYKHLPLRVVHRLRFCK